MHQRTNSIRVNLALEIQAFSPVEFSADPGFQILLEEWRSYLAYGRPVSSMRVTSL